MSILFWYNAIVYNTKFIGSHNYLIIAVSSSDILICWQWCTSRCGFISCSTSQEIQLHTTHNWYTYHTMCFHELPELTTLLEARVLYFVKSKTPLSLVLDWIWTHNLLILGLTTMPSCQGDYSLFISMVKVLSNCGYISLGSNEMASVGRGCKLQWFCTTCCIIDCATPLQWCCCYT